MSNKETIDFINQLISDRKQALMIKSRHTEFTEKSGMSDWRKTFDKYNRTRDRKEKVKRIFNI